MDYLYNNEPIDLIFDSHSDSRGTLTVTSLIDKSHLPFDVDRIFWITNVPLYAHRGMHAHRSCWEAIVPVHGQFKVRLNDGKELSRIVSLNSPHHGLIIPPMVWCELYDFSNDAVCLCLASGNYDKEGYISDYATFLKLVYDAEHEYND